MSSSSSAQQNDGSDPDSFPTAASMIFSPAHGQLEPAAAFRNMATSTASSFFEQYDQLVSNIGEFRLLMDIENIYTLWLSHVAMQGVLLGADDNCSSPRIRKFILNKVEHFLNQVPSEVIAHPLLERYRELMALDESHRVLEARFR